jgi:hypothetical protein
VTPPGTPNAPCGASAEWCCGNGAASDDDDYRLHAEDDDGPGSVARLGNATTQDEPALAHLTPVQKDSPGAAVERLGPAHAPPALPELPLPALRAVDDRLVLAS